MPYIGTSPSNGVRRKHTYTATASQTSFSGAGAEGATLSYNDSNFVDVYQNGVKLSEADYTSTSGTAIVLAQGASVSDIVEVVVYDVFSVADTVSKADGGTFDSNISIGGTLGVTGKTGVGTSSPAAAFHVQTTADGTGLSGDDIYVARFQNQEATSDRSFGLDIQAGSSTTDQALRIKDHDGTNTLMIVDGLGHITKPKQSAFMAQPGSQIANIATGANEHLAFSTERFDQNSDYNNSTYQFTAPVTGKYMCNVNLYFVYLDAAANYYELRVDTSNRDYYTIIDPDFGQDNVYFCLSFSQLVDMDANDTCDINFHQAGGSQQTHVQVTSVWSMYLVA